MGRGLGGKRVRQMGDYPYPTKDTIAYPTETAGRAEVKMKIKQPPRLITQDSPGGRPLPPRQVTAGVVKRVKTIDGWRETSGNILLQVSPPNADLAFGQRVAVLGMLARPAPAMNPGGFDWARYFREQRIPVSIAAPQPENERILAAGGFPPIPWLRRRAPAAPAKGFRKSQSTHQALLRSLTL